MAYLYQTFSGGQVLTAAHMNQVEYNIRDHVHGASGVAELTGDHTLTGIWTHRNSSGAGLAVIDIFTNGPTVPARHTVFIDGFSVAPGIIGRKASGTEAAPTNTKQGDDLVLLKGVGHTGSAWTDVSGYVGLWATQNWSSTAQGTAFVVGLTSDDTVARTPYPYERLVLMPDGRMSIVDDVGAWGSRYPSASCALDLKSTKGALRVPRMTIAQRSGITTSGGTPVNGCGMIMYLYDTPYSDMQMYRKNDWVSILPSSGYEFDIKTDPTGRIGVGLGSSAFASTDVLFEVKGTGKALLVSRMTAAERPTTTAVNGMILYLSDYTDMQMYRKNQWRSILPAIDYEYDITTASTSRMGLGVGTGSIATKALLELNSTSKVLLVSRMTAAQRPAGAEAINGMIVYCSDYTDMQMYRKGDWRSILPNTGYEGDIKTESTSRLGLRIGTSSIAAGAALEIGGTDGALLLPRLTTTERNNLGGVGVDGSAGMIFYNTSVPAFQGKVGSNWGNLVHDTIGAISTATGVVMISGARLGIGGSPNAYATLDLQSTTGALLIPRVTQAQRDAITPTNGMMVYLTDSYNTFLCYENSAWRSMTTGIIHVNTTTVGNVGTGEDDLMSYTMPANTLNKDNRAIKIQVWGNFGATANSKTVNIYFGGTVVGQIVTSAGAGDWNFEMTVIRSASNVQKLYTKGNYNGSSSYSYTVGLAKTDSASIIIKCTGTGTADNDIEQKVMIVETLN